MNGEFVRPELTIYRSGAFFSFADATEQSQDQVLAVSLDDETVLLLVNGFYE